MIFQQRRWRCLCLVLPGVFLLAGCVSTPGRTTPTTVVGASNGTNDAGAGGSSTPSISASLLEQLSLERVNRARLKPAAEAAAGGIAIDEGIPGQLDTTPKQPLAMNELLRQAARSHSSDMLARNYFDHDTPEGTTPFDRIRNAGYVYTAAGENLAWRGTTGPLNEIEEVERQQDDLFVDQGIDGRGHRITMLHGGFREVGIGIVRGGFTQDGTVFDSIMQTQDYGSPPVDSTFVLGVVYDDNNNDGQYDLGEGTANVSVTLGSVIKTTNAAGGYSFEVGQADTYLLRFASGQSQTITIGSGTPNIKVDVVDRRDVVINLGLGPLN